MLQVLHGLHNARNRYNQTVSYAERRTDTHVRFAQRELTISITRVRHNRAQRRLTISERYFTQRGRGRITRPRLVSKSHFRTLTDHVVHLQDVFYIQF